MAAEKISKSMVVLIPWDPDNADHVDRLLQQRIACGWNKDPDVLQSWRESQRQGKMAIQWVVSKFLHLGACNPH